MSMSYQNPYTGNKLPGLAFQRYQKTWPRPYSPASLASVRSSLTDSVRQGDIQEMKLLLEKFSNGERAKIVNFTDWKGWSPLASASRELYLDKLPAYHKLLTQGQNLHIDNLAIVKYLVRECEADPNYSCDVDKSPLAVAISRSNVSCAKFLVAYGADLRKKLCINSNPGSTYQNIHSVHSYCTPLFAACNMNNKLVDKTMLVNMMLILGADVNESYADKKEKSTCLMMAVSKNDHDLVRVLLKSKADVNISNHDGLTALHYSIQYKASNKIVSALLKCGANVNTITSHKTSTPLHCAIHNKTRSWLLGYSKNVNEFNKDGVTVLHIAILSNISVVIVKDLLNHGADVNAVDKNGSTALHFAIHKESNRETVKVLIENGADVNSVNNKGHTPFHYCVRQGSEHLQLLINNVSSLTFNGIDHLSCSLLIKILFGKPKPENVANFINCAIQNETDIIHAYELAGAASIIVPRSLRGHNYNQATASKYWTKALEMRICKNIEKDLPRRPKKMYDNEVEFQTIEEMKKILEDPKRTLFNAFLVVERIVGQDNEFFIKMVKQCFWGRHSHKCAFTYKVIDFMKYAITICLNNPHLIHKSVWLIGKFIQIARDQVKQNKKLSNLHETSWESYDESDSEDDFSSRSNPYSCTSSKDAKTDTTVDELLKILADISKVISQMEKNEKVKAKSCRISLITVEMLELILHKGLINNARRNRLDVIVRRIRKSNPINCKGQNLLHITVDPERERYPPRVYPDDDCYYSDDEDNCDYEHELKKMNTTLALYLLRHGFSDCVNQADYDNRTPIQIAGDFESECDYDEEDDDDDVEMLIDRMESLA